MSFQPEVVVLEVCCVHKAGSIGVQLLVGVAVSNSVGQTYGTEVAPLKGLFVESCNYVP